MLFVISVIEVNKDPTRIKQHDFKYSNLFEITNIAFVIVDR